MSTIERLKEMEKVAKRAETIAPEDERRDTHENFQFVYALAEAWPKLLAVVEAAENFIAVRELGGYSHHEYQELIASVVACKGAAQ